MHQRWPKFKHSHTLRLISIQQTLAENVKIFTVNLKYFSITASSGRHSWWLLQFSKLMLINCIFKSDPENLMGVETWNRISVKKKGQTKSKRNSVERFSTRGQSSAEIIFRADFLNVRFGWRDSDGELSSSRLSFGLNRDPWTAHVRLSLTYPHDPS